MILLGNETSSEIASEYRMLLIYLQIVFEAVRGVSYRGDIALDDIALKDGSCPSSGKNCSCIIHIFLVSGNSSFH